MAGIRKVFYFDKPKIKKMISFLDNNEVERFTKFLMNVSLDMFHQFLPVNFKFLPETYVLYEGDDLHGLISVTPTAGNPRKVNITKLLFDQNYYDVGKQLVEYVIARYGARGAESFRVAVDDSHDELMQLFVNGCGFRQCASEQLWKLNHFSPKKLDNTQFRPFKVSDAKDVCELFNDSLITHFKPSLLNKPREFKSNVIFQGLSTTYELKYIVEDSDLNKLWAYFSIITFDNINYILDLTVSEGYNLDFNNVLSFAYKEIAKRKRNFSLFVKVKKYVKNAEFLEKYLEENEFTCIQNQIILVKDFYKLIKQENRANLGIVLFNEQNKAVFKNE